MGNDHGHEISDACLRTHVGLGTSKLCDEFERMPLNSTTCASNSRVVPRVFHAIDKSPVPPVSVANIARENVHYRVNYHDDVSGLSYVRRMCGTLAANAYQCLGAPANRADLFRFCAMYAEGGVYLDSDLVPLRPLDEMYAPCVPMTMGRDFPHMGRGFTPGTQMKILAGVQGQNIWKCMLDSIINHVAWRYVPTNPLNVSGPYLLTHCVQKVKPRPGDVAYTYRDTRLAAWPYTGMRSDTSLFAFEQPNIARHWKNQDSSDYALLHRNKKVYTSSCLIPPMYQPWKSLPQDAFVRAPPPPPPRGKLFMKHVLHYRQRTTARRHLRYNSKYGLHTNVHERTG